MTLNHQKLSGLHMWQDWQKKVEEALPNFAANPIYVEQLSPTDAEFESAIDLIQASPIDLAGKTRDAEFGGIVRQTKIGPMTRMWLDANVELHFLRKHLMAEKRESVLEIGAGYGRLAVMGMRVSEEWTCVDAVPISSRICHDYCARFNPSVMVATLEEFCKNASPGQFDMAVNIHSWNECSVEQIQNWLDALVYLKIPNLFTVSHGRLDTDSAYKTQEPGQPSWRHLLEDRFNLVVEESIGLGNHPHAVWALKA